MTMVMSIPTSTRPQECAGQRSIDDQGEELRLWRVNFQFSCAT